ncbi:hypothetical protein ACS0TY_036003 [Phlomoides rotata]
MGGSNSSQTRGDDAISTSMAGAAMQPPERRRRRTTPTVFLIELPAPPVIFSAPLFLSLSLSRNLGNSGAENEDVAAYLFNKRLGKFWQHGYSRVILDTIEELVEYFLDTEAQEIEFEIARVRPRLNEDFFTHLKLELGKLRFAVSKTQDTEDRIIELETLSRALEEGVEAYDKMQSEIVTTMKSLVKILTSEDIKATVSYFFYLALLSLIIFPDSLGVPDNHILFNTVQLLDLVEQNELSRIFE